MLHSSFQRVCRPCKKDEDCVPVMGALDKRYLCLDFGGEKGRFCGVSCSNDLECPEDFRCLDVEGGGRQCYPSSGTCPCPQHYKEFETVCYRNNEYGTCYGTRHCDTECTAKTPEPEACNLEDDDCDGETDEERTTGECGIDGYSIFYYDADKDTYYGQALDKKCLCAPSGEYTGIMPGDCNDNDPTVNPGATEKCNSKDDDCDNETDEERTSGQCDIDGYKTYYYDADNDTYGVTGNTKCLCSASGSYSATRGGDCDDTDSRVHPGGESVCGKDGDCDGSPKDPGEECDDGNSNTTDGCVNCVFVEFQVNTWTTGSQGYPSITSLSSGGFVVVWQSDWQDGSYSGVYARIFSQQPI